jgi:hypothetical protein
MGGAIAISRRRAGCVCLSVYSTTSNEIRTRVGSTSNLEKALKRRRFAMRETNEKEIRIRIVALTLKL